MENLCCNSNTQKVIDEQILNELELEAIWTYSDEEMRAIWAFRDLPGRVYDQSSGGAYE